MMREGGGGPPQPQGSGRGVVVHQPGVAGGGGVCVARQRSGRRCCAPARYLLPLSLIGAHTYLQISARSFRVLWGPPPRKQKHCTEGGGPAAWVEEAAP